MFLLYGKVIPVVCTLYCKLAYKYRGADYKARDINNYIPIMRAIMCGQKSVIKTILEFGCEVTMPIKQQKTLLEWAIENEYNVLIEVI